MTRGALLFAFNSPKYDYYAMAEYTARRINFFLDLPVTLVTNKESIPANSSYKFDKVITIEADESNIFRQTVWFNKGRFKAFYLTPYDETLLLDVDYMVNSDRLNGVFDLLPNNDYLCHQSTAFMMVPLAGHELLSPYSYPTLWATVLAFQKTKKTEQMFNCIEMIQHNYQHYANIHGFPPEIFRNDFALTLAHKIIDGHLPTKQHIIPWNLMHIGIQTNVYTDGDEFFNNKYVVVYDSYKRSKIKKEYITIKDMDFHTINKDIFVELMS